MPFNAVCDGTTLVDEIIYEKSKINKPILSEDQLNIIQEKILDSFNSKELIKIKYYMNHRVYEIENIIKKIDNINRLIELKNGKRLSFSQILHIS
jgi:hypothetical protein